MAPTRVPRCEVNPVSIREDRGIQGGRLFVFPRIPSTNRWAMDHLEELRHGDAVRAVRQTAGRGRFEREWVSPGDRGLALSFVLDPARVGKGDASRLTQATALAVRAALARMGVKAHVKWPNDVCAAGRKIAGILAEGRSDAAGIVVGVGLNVNLSARDLRRSPWGLAATSMRVLTGRSRSVAVVAERVIRELDAVLDCLRSDGEWLAREWRAHDALKGRRIVVHTPHGAEEGLYLGAARDGSLRMRVARGQVEEFRSGDVSVRVSRPSVA